MSGPPTPLSMERGGKGKTATALSECLVIADLDAVPYSPYLLVHGFRPRLPVQLKCLSDLSNDGRDGNEAGSASEMPMRPGGESMGGARGEVPFSEAAKRRSLVRDKFLVRQSAH